MSTSIASLFRLMKSQLESEHLCTHHPRILPLFAQRTALALTTKGVGLVRETRLDYRPPHTDPSTTSRLVIEAAAYGIKIKKKDMESETASKGRTLLSDVIRSLIGSLPFPAAGHGLDIGERTYFLQTLFSQGKINFRNPQCWQCMSCWVVFVSIS